MSKRRNKRRFYPEFYTEEELKQYESEREKNSLIENENNENNEENEETEASEIKEGEIEPNCDIYQQPNVIVYKDYQPPGISDVRDVSDIGETIEDEINEPTNLNGLVYPKKPDTSAVYRQIDYMEKDYLQQKIDILNSNQNVNNMMNEMDEIDDKHGIEPENEYEYPAAVENENNENNGIKIEIPPHMYIDEMQVKQSNDYNYNVSEDMKTEQTIPVFSEIPAISVNPELSPNIEIAREAEPEIKIEESPEIYINSKIIPFDREKAIEYARRWALDRNPQYYNFEELGGDCTNYISQILLAGGCKMDKSSPVYGWYYNHANDKSHSWTGVEQLYDYLVRDKEHGIIAKEINLDEVEAGDIIQLSFNGKTFQHTPFIVSVKRMPSGELSFDRMKICAHSFDSENRALDTYQWRKIRVIRILGYKEK